jgi:hypothetical protein
VPAEPIAAATAAELEAGEAGARRLVAAVAAADTQEVQTGLPADEL